MTAAERMAIDRVGLPTWCWEEILSKRYGLQIEDVKRRRSLESLFEVSEAMATERGWCTLAARDFSTKAALYVGTEPYLSSNVSNAALARYFGEPVTFPDDRLEDLTLWWAFGGGVRNVARPGIVYFWHNPRYNFHRIQTPWRGGWMSEEEWPEEGLAYGAAIGMEEIENEGGWYIDRAWDLGADRPVKEEHDDPRR